VFGLLLLAAFIPLHIRVWPLFPVWYHLAFLVTIVPLVLIGWHLTKMRAPHASLVTSSHA
jgi:hypothetical protein